MKPFLKRSYTVRSVGHWRWFEYVLFGIITVVAIASRADAPWAWTWPVCFAIYVWANGRDVKHAYLEGYALGQADARTKVTRIGQPPSRVPTDDN